MKLRMVFLLLTAVLLAACGLGNVDVSVDEPTAESPSAPQVVTVVVVVTPTPEPIEAPPKQDTPVETAPIEPAKDDEEAGAGDAVTSDPPPNLPSGSWQPILDLPRTINDLVVDPQNPQLLYAGTGSTGSGSGVYKSEDDGLTWQLAANGLPSEDVRALAVSPVDPPALIAAVGHGDVYASADGSQSWARLGNYELSGFEARMAVAPSDPNVVFITEDVRGLYRSLDGGHTWLPLTNGLPKDDNDIVNVQSLTIDPKNANVVYVGTGWGSFNANGVYKSTDGGETWVPANRGMIDYGITALAVNPSDSQIIFAGGNGGEFFKSTDSGESWTDFSGRLPIETSNMQPIRDIIINPDTPDTIFLLHDRAGILFSYDGGERWHQLGKPGELNYASFTALAVIFNPQPVLIVGIKDEGGWRYAPSTSETNTAATSSTSSPEQVAEIAANDVIRSTTEPVNGSWGGFH